MPLRIATARKEIVWNGSFFVHHSLALVNRELALALLDDKAFDSKFDLSIDEFEPPTFEPDARLKPLASRRSSGDVSSAVTIRHRWPPVFERPSSGKLVMIQPWEYGSLPRAWVNAIPANVDEVWVPSSFVRDCYVESGVAAETVQVVPNGVNVSRFHPGVTPYDFRSNTKTAHIPADAYKFLFVGGTIARKGIDVLLDAYDRAFTSKDPVVLIIKDFGANSFYANQGMATLIRALQVKPGGARIVYLADDMSEGEIAALYAGCDCLLHPYRGEGYGLPIAEAMAVGKPTVVTGAGAALDFTSEETSFLVPATRTNLAEKKIGEMETIGQPFWYEPDREALSAILKSIVADPSDAAARGAKASKRIAERHTWAAAASIAAERLSLVSERADRPSTTVGKRFGNLKINSLGGETGAPLLDSGISHYEVDKQKALAKTRAGRWPDAVKEIEACLVTNPDDWDLQNALAVALFRTKQTDKAIALLEKGLADSPLPRDFHHNLAFILIESGRPLDALDQALNAFAISPENRDIARTVERARDGVLKLARRVFKRYSADQRGAAKRDPEYRSLMDRYNEAGETLMNGAKTKPAPKAVAITAKGKISLCMIAKNEERFLRGCLESVQGIVDEIVIVDTGSSDSTVAIAKEFGAIVVDHSWNDDFSEARNVSLDHATGDWALWLDADEEIADGTADLFRSTVRNAPQHVGGYMVQIRNWLQSTTPKPGSEMAVHHACRLFRRLPTVRFEGRIHEQNLRSILAAGLDYIRIDGLAIEHFGYSGEVMDLRNKHERFIRMLKREVEECPDDAFKNFHLFNLGNAYYTRGDMENALIYLQEASEDADITEEYTNTLFTELATAYQRLQRSAEGLEACRRADDLGMRFTGIEFARGFCLLHLERYVEAEAAFKLAMELGLDTGALYAKTGDAGVSSYKSQQGLALALVGQDRFEEAVPYCRAAIEAQPGFVDCRYLLGVCLMHEEEFDEARRELETVLTHAPKHGQAMRKLADLLVATGGYSDALPYLRAVDLFGDDPEVIARLAECAEKLGLLEDSAAAYRRLRWLAPESPEICVNLGRVLASAGNQSEAIDCFTDAIALRPEYANSYLNAGDLLYTMGYFNKAADAYIAGLQREATNANAFFTLGNCFFRMKNLEAATIAYSRALDLDPAHEAAAHNLALTRSEEEDLAKAA